MKGAIRTVSGTAADNPGGKRDDEWSQCLELIGRARDRAAFARLFTHFAPLVKAFALGGSPLAASHSEELVQEVMIKVWQKASAFDARKASASTWIYTIARNCRTDLYRRLQKFDTPISADDIWPDMDTGDLFAAVQSNRDASRVRGLLGELPHEQAQILAKVYMEGKSHSEVAEELDLPLGTVKSRVRLAMNKLQLMVEK
ncbi:sigma-70 family RNA polymerase sigma factor [Mangrovimicrobium sediminis]|uniref:RNA polymerase sigma factor n=1 Tax=Mangrovimicrobium sediminis TaxID=2562682 RepID=A0A4Z0M5Y6_9GAMM|nr:sigma-70 family RNA polymerase sigma factor [Haliea sp. SAOS-164]